MVFKNKVYDVLKWIAMYLLPAAGTLYFALAQVWGLPYGEQIVGTITAVDAFLGVVLGISKVSYDGDGTITWGDNEAEVDLNLSDEEVADGKLLNLKVKRGS